MTNKYGSTPQLFSKRSIVRLLLVGFMLTFAFSAFPYVHAASIVITTKAAGSMGGVGVTSGTTSAFTPGAGDVIVIDLPWVGCSAAAVPVAGCVGTALPPTSVTDSQSDTYTKVTTQTLSCTNGGNTFQCFTVQYIATAASAISTTISITFGANTCAATGGFTGCTLYYQVLDAASAYPQTWCTALGNAQTGTALTTSTSCAFPTGGAAIAAGIGAGTITGVGTGYTLYGSGVFEATAYSTSLSAPTNFPMTSGTSGIWLEAGFTLGTTAPAAAANACTHAVTCAVSIFVSPNSAIVIAAQTTNNLQVVKNPFTDSLGNTFALQSVITQYGSTGYVANNTAYAAIFTSQASFTGTDTITITVAPTGAALIGIQAYDFIGVSATPTCIGEGGSTSSINILTATTCTIPAGGYGIASLTGLGAYTISPGAGYTLTPTIAPNAASEYQQATGSTSVAAGFFLATIATATINANAAVVLSPGITSCSSASCTGNGGSGPQTTSSGNIISNQTLIYLGTTTQQSGLIITNVTIHFKSASWTNSQTSAKIFVAVWETSNTCPTGHTCGGNTFEGNTNTISSSNPLSLAPIACSQTFTQGTTASAFYIHFLPVTCAILNGTAYAVGFSVSHNGAVAYESGSGNMYNDSSDGYAPVHITTATARSPPVWLSFTWFMPSVTQIFHTTTITTVTGGSGSTTTANGNLSSDFILAVLVMFTIPIITMAIGAKAGGGMAALGGLLMGATLSSFIMYTINPTYFFLLPLFGIADLMVILLLARSGGN